MAVCLDHLRKHVVSVRNSASTKSTCIGSSPRFRTRSLEVFGPWLVVGAAGSDLDHLKVRSLVVMSLKDNLLSVLHRFAGADRIIERRWWDGWKCNWGGGVVSGHGQSRKQGEPSWVLF